MDKSGKSVRLYEIREEVGKIDDEIKKAFTNGIASYSIPDRVPPDWAKEKVKISIPIDLISYEGLRDVVDKVEKDIIRRRHLRKEEAALLLSLGEINIMETVPE